MCELVVTPNMSAAHCCFSASEHQSSDPCLPLVITTAALVLLTLLLPQYCAHWFVDHSFYHLTALARPQALWSCGDQLRSPLLGRWNLCQENVLCTSCCWPGRMRLCIGGLRGSSASSSNKTFPGQIKKQDTFFWQRCSIIFNSCP